MDWQRAINWEGKNKGVVALSLDKGKKLTFWRWKAP
jgi:hypothetical protein